MFCVAGPRQLGRAAEPSRNYVQTIFRGSVCSMLIIIVYLHVKQWNWVVDTGSISTTSQLVHPVFGGHLAFHCFVPKFNVLWQKSKLRNPLLDAKQIEILMNSLTRLLPLPTSCMWWQAPSKRIPSAALKARLSRGKPAPTSTNPELFFFCGEIPRNFFSKDSRMMSYSRREVAMLCVRLCSLTVRQKPEAMVRFYDPMWWICHTYWAKVQTYIFPKITFICIGYNILLIAWEPNARFW